MCVWYSKENSQDKYDQIDSDDLNEDQVGRIRIFLLSNERHSRMERISELILGSQAGRSVVMLDIEFSSELLSKFEIFKRTNAHEKLP